MILYTQIEVSKSIKYAVIDTDEKQISIHLKPEPIELVNWGSKIQVSDIIGKYSLEVLDIGDVISVKLRNYKSKYCKIKILTLPKQNYTEYLQTLNSGSKPSCWKV